MTSRSLLRVFAATAMLAGCSSNNPGTGSQGGSGGQSSGGSSANGGTSSGGQSGHGGSTTGGTSGSGGASTGGASASGGQSSGGGAGQGGSGSGGTGGSFGSAAGGQGGTSKTGGTTGSGDASVTGGAGGANSGGSPATGGAAGAGSGGTVAATGGTKAAGGAGGMSGGGGIAPGSGGSGAGGTSGTAGGTGTQHWVGTWTASPYVDTNSSNTPPISLSNSVIRQVTHVSLGGSQLRVQFSNLRGNGSLTINGAHIALCKATPTVDSTIDVSTDKALAFSGTASVTIAQGKEVWSDPIDFIVPNQGNITISTSFGTVPSTITQHSGSRTTSYFQSGGTTANLAAANMTSATSKALWFFIAGIDVMADASAVGVVAVGDSITDGRGSDTDKNNRWTDILAARLQGNAATAKVTMMNEAIGATSLAGSDNTTAQSRFNRDVLGQSGVKYVIVYDGVNDIGSSGSSFTTLKAAYDDLISRAHAKGLLIYGATILPFGGNSYYSTGHESVRQQVNTYIKSGAFDGYIDFDAALTDGGNPPKLKTEYATWAQTDGLHPGPAGYQKMGETPDLTLFTK